MTKLEALHGVASRLTDMADAPSVAGRLPCSSLCLEKLDWRASVYMPNRAEVVRRIARAARDPARGTSAVAISCRQQRTLDAMPHHVTGGTAEP